MKIEIKFKNAFKRDANCVHEMYKASLAKRCVTTSLYDR